MWVKFDKIRIQYDKAHLNWDNGNPDDMNGPKTQGMTSISPFSTNIYKKGLNNPYKCH